jgi:hypothetical protein
VDGLDGSDDRAALARAIVELGASRPMPADALGALLAQPVRTALPPRAA